MITNMQNYCVAWDTSLLVSRYITSVFYYHAYCVPTTYLL